jgi:hypothetical protein
MKYDVKSLDEYIAKFALNKKDTDIAAFHILIEDSSLLRLYRNQIVTMLGTFEREFIESNIEALLEWCIPEFTTFLVENKFVDNFLDSRLLNENISDDYEEFLIKSHLDKGGSKQSAVEFVAKITNRASRRIFL